MSAITSFTGPHAFLSNFYVEANGKSTEHYFQAAKTLDLEESRYVMDAATPGQAKRRGRQVTLRLDWDDQKVQVMARCLLNKFDDPYLRKLLVDTGDCLLVEGNTWHDNDWGDCLGRECFNQPGHNWLGIILMTLRQNSQM